jgi:pyridoxal phosphate enzyme (YggS family)
LYHIAENINQLAIPQGVKLIAVSKTQPVAAIREAMSVGQLLFGENKAQELVAKQAQIPSVTWHFIGHLQTNKVKQIAAFVQMIHTVDSFRLLEEIDCQAQKQERVIDCLLQLHIAREEQKFGLTDIAAFRLLETAGLRDLHHIRICGLMGIATNTDDRTVVCAEFHNLAQIFNRIKRDYFSSEASFCELSMGMSDDYMIAIDEGSTMVRIGSTIFGKRIYT